MRSANENCDIPLWYLAISQFFSIVTSASDTTFRSMPCSHWGSFAQIA